MKRLIAILVALITWYSISHANTPTIESAKRKWTIEDSKLYAKDQINAWSIKQYNCLVKLWHKESNWRPNAYNKVKVMGRNAGGIPQLLGLSPMTPATEQIERGLDYIYVRYTTPCLALKFHNQHGWY